MVGLGCKIFAILEPAPGEVAVVPVGVVVGSLLGVPVGEILGARLVILVVPTVEPATVGPTLGVAVGCWLG